jgi:hypothetical protein
MIQIKKDSMRRAIFLLPLFAAACATPRESCISTSRAQLYALQNQINTTQGNIQRGYAIASVQDNTTAMVPCVETRFDGTNYRSFCQVSETTNRQLPVAIDVGEERRKLAQLQTRVTPLQRTTEVAVQQCIAIHPE